MKMLIALLALSVPLASFADPMPRWGFVNFLSGHLTAPAGCNFAVQGDPTSDPVVSFKLTDANGASDQIEMKDASIFSQFNLQGDKTLVTVTTGGKVMTLISSNLNPTMSFVQIGQVSCGTK